MGTVRYAPRALVAKGRANMGAIEFLIVTSDPHLAARLGAGLERQRATCRITAEPAAAIRSLVEERPAIVVVDELYTTMDPQRLVRRARGCAGLAMPAIILLQALDRAHDPWLTASVDTVLDRDVEAATLVRTLAASMPVD